MKATATQLRGPCHLQLSLNVFIYSGKISNKTQRLLKHNTLE